MSGMCKSDQWQNSRNKRRYEAARRQNTWATHKEKKARRLGHEIMKAAHRAARRLAKGKPFRGYARAMRRAHLQRGTV